MFKTFKRILAITLSAALLASTVLISGIFPVSAAEDIPNPYPVYRDIDFSKYTVVGGASGNSYTGKYADGSAAVYWKEVRDDTADGGKYIRYDTTNVVENDTPGATTWLGNHAFAPSENGTRTTLPANTTFRITYKIRTDAVDIGINGFVSFVNAPGSLNDVASGTITWSPKKLEPSKEWTEYSFLFTTPDTEKAFYAGFNAVGTDGKGIKVGYSYDIDHVTLEIVNNEKVRVVDFSQYVVGNSGMWGYSQGANTPVEYRWATIEKDETLSGDSYYKYSAFVEGGKGLNTWYGHYGIAPTITGSVSATGDMNDSSNIVLPTSTTYRLTVRMRVNEVSGDTKLYRAFTVGQTTQGNATAIATLNPTDGFVTYTDVFTTPSEYTVSGTSTYNRFYISVYNAAAGNLSFDIDYIKLEQIDTVRVTFNANGGNFSGSETVTENAVVGDAPATQSALTAPDKYAVLAGWSTSANSAKLVTEITENMAGTTLYAVWNRDAHAGGYVNVSTVIDFSEYTPSTTNSYYFDDGQGNTQRLFWTKNPVADATTKDGNYLRYEALNGKGASWRGNHALALSKNGAKESLPTSTTYEMTLRVRGNTIPASGMYPWIAFCDGLRGYEAANYKADACFTEFTNSKVYATGEWTEIKVVFTTPDAYAYNTAAKATFDKFFIGFYTGTAGVNYCYDLDTVTLKKVTTTNFYVDANNDGTFELYDSVIGVPGEALSVPDATEIKEIYNTDGTGYQEIYAFDKWYSDQGCTQNAILKYGNFDVNLYCKPTVTSDADKLESQIGFVGFDQYYEMAAGASLNKGYATITKEEAYSGTSSLKLDLSAGAVSAELKNSINLPIKNGQTYKVTLKYKTDAAASLALGLGKISDVGSGKNIALDEATVLTPSDDWQTLSLMVNAVNFMAPEKDCALALVASSDSGATLYIDTVTVSAVTTAISAQKTDGGIRFMGLYNCGGDGKMVIEGIEQTIVEHGFIVSGADNTAPLTVEGAAGNSGVMKVSATDLSKYFSRNPATNATTYSVLLDGVAADDTYDFAARGYVRFANGDIYYSDVLVSSAEDANEVFDIVIPENGINKLSDKETTVFNTENRAASYYVFLPAGTTFYSDKTYLIERWTGINTGWISPNFSGSGSYRLESDAYCELTVYGGSLNDDLQITVPVEEQHRVIAGFSSDMNKNAVGDVLANASDSAVNYIFISDVHTGAFLRKDPTGTYWTTYEAATDVNNREQAIIKRLTEIVDIANNNDIDLICIGGDLVNGYETYLSPMYQEALAAGKVNNVREFVILQIQTILAPLKNSQKPVFILMGNHDSNEGQSQFYNDYYKQNNTSGPSVNIDEIISDRDWLNGVMKEFINVEIVQDPNYKDTNGDLLSKYYYYDFVKNGEDKRVICLDDVDTRHIFDENGKVIQMTSGRRMSYTKEQLQFVANALETATGDVLFLSHQGVDGTTEAAGNSDVLGAIITAYQTKSAYTNASFGIDVDFSETAGQVVAFHSGHTHEIQNHYSENAKVWNFVSSMGTGSYDIVSASSAVVYRISGGKVTKYHNPTFN